MSTRRNGNGKTLTEWLPPFKSGGYDPGDYAMPEPAGKGVQDRGTTQIDGVEAYDSELSGMGKEWPRDHNETAAMCDVDDDGVEHKSQGGHESTHATANDGIQKHLKDLNLKTPQKNTGSGVAEPFGGDRWSDGGVLGSDHGPGPDTWTHEEGPGMPDEGPITGTSGPQQGQPTNESWSPQNMARLMGGEVDMQSMFDSYARNASAVCLEDFQNLLEAHGIDAALDHTSLLQLMDQNQEFVFHEGRDSDGPYWVGETITESTCPKCGCDPCECKKAKGKKEGEQRPPFDECDDACQAGMKPKKKKPVPKESRSNRGGTINEMQVRSPEEEAGMYRDDPFEHGEGEGDIDSAYGGDPDIGSMLTPHGGPSDPMDAHDELGSRYDERLGGGMGGAGGPGPDDEYTDIDPLDSDHTDGHSAGGDPLGRDFAAADQMNMECPGCGYTGEEAECPECGAEMMDPMENLPGRGGDMIDQVADRKHEEWGNAPQPGDDDFEHETHGVGGTMDRDASMWESRNVTTGPQIIEGLKNFMTSARSLIERNPQAHRRDIAEALNYSWEFHAGHVDARTCPGKVQQTLQGLMTKFPGFSPLVENEAMEKSDSTGFGLNRGDGPKIDLPNQPTEMTTHGDKSLLGKSQKGTAMAKTDTDGVGGDLWLPGTEKKLTGKTTNEGMMPAAPAAPQQRPAAPQQRPGAAAPAAAPQQRPAAPQQRPGAAAPAAAPQQKPAAPAAAPAPAGAATQVAQENINRLNKYVKKHLREGAQALRGNFTMQFSILVTEGKMPDFIKDKIKGGKEKGKPPVDKKGKKDKKRTPKRDSLAEALADAEEMLQMHAPQDLTFEATFLGPQGQIAMKQDIPLFTIMPRGPMVGEGKALFRFQRHAEAFANQLAMEGVTSRISSHNWGSAVQARTNYSVAARAFDMISEDEKKKKKWMQGVKHTGECTPMSKPTCTGKKLAFAKRVQKGGDLHQGGEDD